MEELPTLAGRSVQVLFEPKRDAAKLLTDAYQRLSAGQQDVDPLRSSVQNQNRSVVTEAVK